jgi:hypothetical protein
MGEGQCLGRLVLWVIERLAGRVLLNGKRVPFAVRVVVRLFHFNHHFQGGWMGC